MTKPNEFPPAGPLTGAEILPILQGLVDSRTTLNDVIEQLGISPDVLQTALDDLNLGSVATFMQGNGNGEIPTGSQVATRITNAITALALGTASQATVGVSSGQLPTIDNVISAIVTAIDAENLGSVATFDQGTSSGQIPTNAQVLAAVLAQRGEEPDEIAAGNDERFITAQRYLQRTAGLSEFIGRAYNNQPATAVIVGDSYIELGVLGDVTARLYRIFNPATTAPSWRSIRAVFPWNSVQGTASTHGLNGYSNIMSNGQVCSITISCDRADIYYCTGTGSIEVRVDSVLVATVDTTTGFRWQSGDLGYASHTITLTSVGNTEPYGGMFHALTQSAGVQIHGKGHTGWSALAMNDVATYNDGTLRHITNVQPQLVFYQLNINDYGAGDAGALATAITNWTDTIQDIQAAAPLASVVVIASPAVGLRANWLAYVEALHQVARDNNCMFVDTFKAIGSFSNGVGQDPRGYQSGDGVHLNARGKSVFDATVWDATFDGLQPVGNPGAYPQLTIQGGPGLPNIIFSPLGSALLLFTGVFQPVELANLTTSSAASSAVNNTRLAAALATERTATSGRRLAVARNYQLS